MSNDQDGKKPVSTDAEASAEQDTARERDGGLEAIKPHLIGIVGMHIDQPQKEAAAGSPGAEIDRNQAHEK
jgi:hypothetical protein